MFKVYKLNELVLHLNKSNIKRNELLSDGKYPVVNSSREDFGRYNLFNNDCDSVIISSHGEYAGFVKYKTGKYWAGSLCYPMTTKNNKIIDTKFLYYYLKNLEKTNKEIIVVKGSIPFINLKMLDDLKLKIPPLEVQKEIVEILDKFTTLEAELEAELETRRKQYKYYLEQVFNNFDRGIYKKIGDVGTIERGNGLAKKDFTESGLPCIHYGQIYTHFTNFAINTIASIPEEIFGKLKKVYTGDIIIAVTSENVEDVCKPVAWLGTESVATGGHTAILRHNQNPKFITYFLNTHLFYKQKVKLAKGTKVIEVRPFDLLDIVIPIPSLSVQNEIVSKLDKFSALVEDIEKGLPKEIELRRKQYEYYRNKLLSFEEL